MASIVVSGDTSGAITLSAPSVAGTNTITLPAATGTAMVSGNMPAFSAYPSSNQSVTTSTFTLINYQTKTYDTATAFNNTGSTVTLNGISVPAYAFAPPVAGYYQISINISANTVMTRIYVALYKNGTFTYSGPDIIATQPNTINSTWLVYLNGTSDYVQLYAFGTGTSPQWVGDSRYTFFSGVLVRSA